MCLIIFSYRIKPQLPLVLAANRDEFFSRPAKSSTFRKFPKRSSSILAGKDLKAGGTWIGITRTGRFAAITNIRDPSQTENKLKSRGQITVDFLLSLKTPIEFASQLKANFTQYAGFNLLIGDTKNLVYINSHEELVSELKPGIYGLSNGIINSNWPKINNGRDKLKNLLMHDKDITTDNLITMMYDQGIAADEFLPNTGISIEMERKLSPSFITIPEQGYGTLCTTGIILSDSGLIKFKEQSYNEEGTPTERHYYEFYR